MARGATEAGPAIHLVIEDREVRAQITSLSSSGLATLTLSDMTHSLRSRLDDRMLRGDRIRLRATRGSQSLLVDVTILCVEGPDRAERPLEIFVDGSECTAWSELLRLTGTVG